MSAPDDEVSRDKLLDYFAAAALQGMMASETDGNGMVPLYSPAATWHARTAAVAYQFAEAMLAESAKKRKRHE